MLSNGVRKTHRHDTFSHISFEPSKNCAADAKKYVNHIMCGPTHPKNCASTPKHIMGQKHVPPSMRCTYGGVMQEMPGRCKIHPPHPSSWGGRMEASCAAHIAENIYKAPDAQREVSVRVIMSACGRLKNRACGFCCVSAKITTGLRSRVDAPRVNARLVSNNTRGNPWSERNRCYSRSSRATNLGYRPENCQTSASSAQTVHLAL